MPPGSLPDGAVEISHADLANGFYVTSLIVANAAEIRDGLLFVLGGGWANYNVSSLPCDAVWQLVCSVNWNALDLPAERWLQICLCDPDGIETSRVAIKPSVEVLEATNTNRLVQIGAPLHKAGLWTLHVQSGGFILSQTGVNVELTQ